MEFVYLGLGLGCLVFLFKVILEYMREMPVWKDRVRLAKLEEDKFESEMNSKLGDKEDVQKKTKSLDEEIEKLEKFRDELKTEIDNTVKELESKGRVIRSRHTDSSK